MNVIRIVYAILFAIMFSTCTLMLIKETKQPHRETKTLWLMFTFSLVLTLLLGVIMMVIYGVLL